MKVFVIGGVSVKKGDHDYDGQVDTLERSMRALGQAIVRAGHDLIVCSPFPGSADVEAVHGAVAAQAEKKGAWVEFHHPDDEAVRERLRAFTEDISLKNLRAFSNPTPRDEKGKPEWGHAWLLCQLSALDQSHSVVALGGQVDGSASLLLPLAEGRRKPLLPLTFLGGAAALSYQRRPYELRDRLGKNVRYLGDVKYTNRVVGLLQKLADDSFARSKRTTPIRVFVSYPRSRPQEADFVEMTLLRREFIVFRDESEFGPGQPLPGEIIEHIHEADVFVAIWCQEYACSPWCFDQLEFALKRSSSGGLILWLLCVDGTRVVPPAARLLTNYPARSRVELGGQILQLIERLRTSP
jgi:hypothetical protein